jgi:hypothetical protein
MKICQKASKFGHVVVNYGRLVGFEEHLRLFIHKQVCAQFLRKCAFFRAKHKIFKLDVGDFYTDQKFIFVLKSLRRVKLC